MFSEIRQRTRRCVDGNHKSCNNVKGKCQCDCHLSKLQLKPENPETKQVFERYL